MFSKTAPADAKSTHSVSSTATTLKGADASASKWFSKTPSPKNQVPASTASSTSAKAVHNEAIASYLAFR